jgi:hypothetical protein
MQTLLNNWKFWLMLSLTLGLAPFVPEPHLWGKLCWLLGGAIGMKSIDWFDLLQHALPWLLLFRALFITFIQPKIKTNVK